MEPVPEINLAELVEECEIEFEEEKEADFKEEWQYKQTWMRPY